MCDADKIDMTQYNIDNHFISNRSWRALFERHYKVYTPEDYIDKSWKLFQDNGYAVEFERYSNNPNSKVYTALKSIDMSHNGEFVVGRVQVNEYDALEQLLIMVICDHEVDFNTFK